MGDTKKKYPYKFGVDNPRNHLTLSHYHLCLEVLELYKKHKDSPRSVQADSVKSLIDCYDITRRKRPSS